MTSRAGPRLIVDTDLRGLNDDAFAIHYLVACGRVPDVVTTVFGNTTPEASARDAQRLCESLGRHDVPVETGAAEPVDWSPTQRERVREILKTLPDGAYLAGISPDGTLFRRRERDRTDHAVHAVAGLLAGPSDCTVLALGPLTNIAGAGAGLPASTLARHQLVVSGGSLYAGNVTHHSEFNAFADPYALRTVLAMPWGSVTVVPLDVTQRVNFGAPEVARLGATRTVFGDAVAESRRELHRAQPLVRELMWDAVAAVVLSRPAVVRSALHGDVDVETRPPHLGRLRLTSQRLDGRTRIITEVDASSVRDEFVAAFEEFAR